MAELPAIPVDWTLRQDEVSPGWYVVSLTSRHGPRVEISGTDLQELVDRCLAGANDIEQQLRSQKRHLRSGGA